MKYVYVENGQVKTGPLDLPKNWGNISNFYLLDNQTLKQHGWYQYRFVPATINSNQFYDGSDFVIEATEVVEYQKVKNKTQQDIDNETNNKWIKIRYDRNKLLLESDWTQISDNSLTEIQKGLWRIYRQSLRDITLQPDPFNISWPTPPEN